MTSSSSSNGKPPGMPASVAVAAVAAGLGFALVYGLAGGGNGDAVNAPAAKAPTVAGAPAAAPEAPKSDSKAEANKLATFVRKTPPVDLAEVSFVDGTGAAKTLADFKGKAILLNLWATWCAPCREEMPALDRLQKALGSDKFEVVALAVDRTGAEAAGKFLKSINVENLKLYADPTTKSGNALKALGLPVTILINAEGREAGRLTGPAAWDSDDAKALIKDVLKF